MRTSTSTTIARVAGALATTTLIGLVTIAPASARPDPGPGYTGLSPADVRVWENTNGGGGTSITPIQPATQLLPTDDNAVEYLQVGLGALGGMVVVGAMAAGVARRHGHAHPA